MINASISVFGFFFAFIVGKFCGRRVGVWGFFCILSGMTLISLLGVLFSLKNVIENENGSLTSNVNLFCWLSFRTLKVECLLEFTIFTYLMMLMIIIVFFAVLLFSFYYMQIDPNIIKFFTYLSLFVGFMLLLVTAGNFVVFFVGWEGVGLSSFLLINFWTTRLQATKSALKALLVNRIGDFFLLLAICFIYKVTASINFQTIFLVMPFMTNAVVPMLKIAYIDMIGLFLVIAAVSKSAQAGLHLWLPDAMEGPTPVSAMIHAATMVTAGLYLLMRCSVMLVLSQITMQVIVLIGLVTVLITSVLGLWYYDIKKIIAFSTCSQLGYMMTIIGSSYFTAGFYHLLTHAFFKALLFLAAGVIIHSMQGEQDLRRLAGSFRLKKRNRFSYHIVHVAFLIGTFALVGLFFFSGFYSKEIILFSLFSTANSTSSLLAWVVLNFSVFFTSYYSFRLAYLLFYSRARSSTIYYHVNTVVNLSIFAIAALFILMIFSIISGFFLSNLFLNSYLLSDSLYYNIIGNNNEFVMSGVKLLPLLFIVFGFFAAVWYQESLAEAQQYYANYSYFIQSKYYYDNLVNKIAKSGLWISLNVYLCLDKGILEWVGPHGIVLVLRPLSWSIDFLFFDRRIETSYLGLMFGCILLTGLILSDSTKLTTDFLYTIYSWLTIVG